MRIWKDGERSSTLCPSCERRTDVVFVRREVPLEHPDVTAKDVLVGECVSCGQVALIPQQSTPRLREAIARPQTTVNVRLPGHLVDVLRLLADRWAPGARSASAAVLRLLLQEFGEDRAFADLAGQTARGEWAQGPADQEFSFRTRTADLMAVDEVAVRLALGSRTDVVRGVLAAAKTLVLDGEDPNFEMVMKRALSAVA